MSLPGKHKRVEVVDALRGFALLGLFLCHMTDYFGLFWQNYQQHWVQDFVITVFNGKSYALFALLFGFSFNLLMQAQAGKGIDYRSTYSWRLGILFIFGYLHGLVYYGDILAVLAVCGFFLVAVTRLSNKALIWISLALLLLVPIWLQMGVYLLLDAGPSYYYAGFNEAAALVYQHGSLFDVLSKNAFWGQFGKWAYVTEFGRVWKVMGLFTLGLVLGRIKFFENAEHHLKLLGILALGWGLAIPIVRMMQSALTSNMTDATVIHFTNMIFNYHHATAVLFCQMAVFMIIYRQILMKKILDLQAPCGRMSLSFYVLQSFIGVPIFYGFGYNLFPEVVPENVFVLALGLWAVQVFIAHLWLRKNKYGPLEWLWRAATNYCSPKASHPLKK